MAESNGCEKAFRSVTRGGAVSTSSPGRVLSNMRDCVATMEVHCTRAGSGGKLKVESGNSKKKKTTPGRRERSRETSCSESAKKSEKERGTDRNDRPSRFHSGK